MPILYAGICSDGIAYTFQIIAQKTTDPTVASILMSLESVFAAIGGWLSTLSESLSAVELLGCALGVRRGHARPGTAVRRKLAAQARGTLQLGACAERFARKGHRVDALV